MEKSEYPLSLIIASPAVVAHSYLVNLNGYRRELLFFNKQKEWLVLGINTMSLPQIYSISTSLWFMREAATVMSDFICLFLINNLHLLPDELLDLFECHFGWFFFRFVLDDCVATFYEFHFCSTVTERIFVINA